MTKKPPLSAPPSSYKLYRDDSYRQGFEAVICGVKEGQLELSQTLFYPTAGGQPHDTGTLSLANGEALEVVDVYLEGERIWHVLASPPLGAWAEGEIVTGRIDWQRRFRHMQRHSAQHLLSQAFYRLNPAFQTVSVGLSGALCNVEFAGNPSPEDLRRAQALVNEKIYENMPVRCFEVGERELPNYPLRRPPQVSGVVRLVQMGDWELAACGGTHVAHTSEVGPVKVFRGERARAKYQRIFFSCGLEALAAHARDYAVAYDSSQRFACTIEQVPERMDKLEEDIKTLKEHNKQLTQQLASYLLKEAIDSADLVPPYRLASLSLDETQADFLKSLAKAIEESEAVIVFISMASTDKVRLCFACSPDVAISMQSVLQAALPIVAGRGGGKPQLAQGAGTRPDKLVEALGVARGRVLELAAP